MWGCNFQIKYNAKNIKMIFKDFFRLKAGFKSYGLVIAFIILDFLGVLIDGSMQVTSGYVLLLLFVKAIAFGGIEEIGWRYTFQPFIENKLPYFAATFTTFISWATWHFLFFYVDGSISSVHVIPFLIGLLTNCFPLYINAQTIYGCVYLHMH